MRVTIVMEDNEIIAAVQAGDTEKFGLLYDAYFKKIYAYLFYRTRDRATAEDLVSATFYKAIGAIGKFDTHKGTFSAWLYRIARNTLYDHSRARKPVVPLEYAEAIPVKADYEKDVANRELLRKVNVSLADLSDEQREIVSMRAWDELSYAEIADILHKSEASCKMAFHRASSKLKTLLV